MSEQNGETGRPRGDQPFRDGDGRGTWTEMTYGLSLIHI